MVEIIAEIANAHQGQAAMALDIAEQAVASGADAVKFQIYFAEELLVSSHPRYGHFYNQAFSPKDWDALLTAIKKHPVKIYADVFGTQALDLARHYELDGYKLHSSDLCNRHLLEALSMQSQRVFLAAGGSRFREIRYAIQILHRHHAHLELVLLHGFQSYPSEIEDSCLDRLRHLKELFGSMVALGIMDHISPDSKFATCVPLMAMPYGIQYIEKHITLDRSRKGVDYYSSLNPDEFKTFVMDVRLAEKTLGRHTDPDAFSSGEEAYRRHVKKKWVATRTIPIGQIVQRDDMAMLRSDENVGTLFFEEIEGRVARKTIPKEACITRGHLDYQVLAVIVARLESRRLHQKALLPINQKPAIQHLLERIARMLGQSIVDHVAFCTTTKEMDDALVAVAQAYPVHVFRGDDDNVLKRMMPAIEAFPGCQVVLRITGDDLLVDPDYVRRIVTYHVNQNADYTDAKHLPSGCEVEAFGRDILRQLYQHGEDTNGTEYLTDYITRNQSQFNIAHLPVHADHCCSLRLTLDYQEDYHVIRDLLEAMAGQGKEFDYTLDDILHYFSLHPDQRMKNQAVCQKSVPCDVNTRIDWSRWSHLCPL